MCTGPVTVTFTYAERIRMVHPILYKSSKSVRTNDIYRYLGVRTLSYTSTECANPSAGSRVFYFSGLHR